jgi:predicted transcriptional regulator
MKREEKNKTMTVEFKSLREFEQDLLSLFKDRNPKIQPKNVVYFDSIGSFRGFMTLQKLEILTLIADAEPKSIYELAKMLNRAIAPVQKDCQMLEGSRFIILKKEKGGRGTVTPRLAFQYDRILVKLPNHPYELQFQAAA